MKILVTTAPAPGHLNPMMPLLRAAERAGHDVVVATGRDFVPEVRRRGLGAWAAGPTRTQIFVADEPVSPDRRTEQERMRDGVRMFVRAAVAKTADLSARALSWAPDLVVFECTDLSGAALAQLLGVPAVAHGFGPHRPGLAPFAALAAQELGAELGLPDLDATLLGAAYVDICPPSLHLAPSPWRRTVALRPSVGEVHFGDDLPALVTADDGRPLVYVTTGTMQTEDRFLSAALAGLRDPSIRLVVTTGSLDPGALGPQPDDVVVASFLPQALVLPHVDVLVSHAGGGTTLGALCHGLPQVLLPIGADQHGNAAAVERSGAGVRLDVRTLTPDDVADAVRRVLAVPTYSAAAQTIQAEIEHMPDADVVLDELTTRATVGAST